MKIAILNKGVFVTKLTLKRAEDLGSTSKKTRPHIMIVGRPEWQSLVKDFVNISFGNLNPIFETPSYLDTEKCLGQLEPNLVIVTNYSMNFGLTLEKILAKVPATSVVVMCDEHTLAKVIPTGVHVTTSKDKLRQKLLPILQSILDAQNY